MENNKYQRNNYQKNKKDNCFNTTYNKDNNFKTCNKDFNKCNNSIYPASVTAIAYYLSQNYDEKCIEILAVLFTQLGYTLDSIATINEINREYLEKCNKSTSDGNDTFNLELFKRNFPFLFE